MAIFLVGVAILPQTPELLSSGNICNLSLFKTKRK